MKVIEKIKAAEQAITDALRSLIDLDPEPYDFERLHDDMKRARGIIAHVRESLSGTSLPGGVAPEGDESMSGPAGYDQQAYIEIAQRCMTDEQPIAVTTKIKEAWILVSALQLAYRHPGLTPTMAGAIEQIGRQYQAAITQAHPDAAPLLEMGWDSQFDK